jgi:adenine C2-methylase RlmN of 23S rRNA A2503 and tRNA A37
MVSEHGFTDAQLQRLWLALLREPAFYAAGLAPADADAPAATTTTTTPPTTSALLFTSAPCQRALDALKPPLPKRLRALLERGGGEGGGGPPPIAALSSRAALVRRSARGDAVKLLVRLGDGLEVETVVMVYGLPGSGGGKEEEEEEEEEEDEQTEEEEGQQDGGGADDQQRDQQQQQQQQQQQHEAARPPPPPPPPAAAAAVGRRRAPSGARTAVCFSSQYGCRLGCAFCATGRMGVGANLGAGEIVEQAVLARAACARFGLPPPASALAMGQGEPVCGGNYAAVVSAVRSLTHPARGFALARRRVTLSTVGAAPARIVDLARDLPGVSLALSLHAPDQALRERLVPSGRGAPLDRILAAVDAYTRHSGQRVFVEYVLLAGVNDAREHARALRELLSGRDVVVNAIPWNPVLAEEEQEEEEGGGDGSMTTRSGGAPPSLPPPPPPERFRAPTPEAVAAFHAEVWQGGKGVPCTVRQERGQDIEGACGQLATAVAAERRRQRRRRDEGAPREKAAASGCGGGGGGGKAGAGARGGDLEDAGCGGGDRGCGGGGGVAAASAADVPRPLWRRLLASVVPASVAGGV